MPAVFVHGIPDTYHVWDDVFDHLTRTDVVALALPGFESPVPEGFTATKEEYVDWIIARLEEIGSPVDLVGHDWGSAFTAPVASLRPDLVRTWAGGDVAVSAALEWSPLSKIWQTHGVGERWMAELDLPAFSEQIKGDGVPAHRADELVSRMDATMKDSPSLVFWGREDQYQPVELAESFAKNVKATNLVLLDSGHWPHLQQPRELADALTRHWESVPPGATP
ncbi:alpha/beta hydrolase [Streptomyces sp. NPDC048420]|uniref:alpha/beta fold hydrolase n=1 Tax=Streptomyces sp. NPDC048420 TaxID=3155755 RepID=UPI0034241DEE